MITESRRSINIHLTENIHHWPTLKTVLMVEKALKDSDGPVSLEELKRGLRKKIMDQTLRLILVYLEDKGSILIGPKGVSWIENKNAKFMKFIERSRVIEIINHKRYNKIFGYRKK
ncbi:MAG: hypothetical protein HZB66_01660 [Candidatus Aenigmarchaeota archaeon]|nr:hypothetical protein [Candidatus Aenigmarchaeota archaeon]